VGIDNGQVGVEVGGVGSRGGGIVPPRAPIAIFSSPHWPMISKGVAGMEVRGGSKPPAVLVTGPCPCWSGLPTAVGAPFREGYKSEPDSAHEVPSSKNGAQVRVVQRYSGDQGAEGA
jgi:hypothetical protein